MLYGKGIAKSYCLILSLGFYVSMWLFLSPAKGEDNLPKKKTHNIRLQYRRHIDGNKIRSESNYQITYFSFIPYQLFIFFDTEVIFQDTSFHSIISEINISRPLFPQYEYLRYIDWTVRLQIETSKKPIMSLGSQWHITKIPAITDLAKKYKLKVFLQIYPFKSQVEQGTTDLYLYYSFPLRKDFVYTRGFYRYFFRNHRNDYKIWVQDIIFPLYKGWDIYIRYSYYEQERNKGVGAGVRYLIKF